MRPSDAFTVRSASAAIHAWRDVRLRFLTGAAPHSPRTLKPPQLDRHQPYGIENRAKPSEAWAMHPDEIFWNLIVVSRVRVPPSLQVLKHGNGG